MKIRLEPMLRVGLAVGASTAMGYMPKKDWTADKINQKRRMVGLIGLGLLAMTVLGLTPKGYARYFESASAGFLAYYTHWTLVNTQSAVGNADEVGVFGLLKAAVWADLETLWK